jgi:hypothetical protein
MKTDRVRGYIHVHEFLSRYPRLAIHLRDHHPSPWRMLWLRASDKDGITLYNTRAVVNSIDVVSRLEAIFVCLVPHGRGVDGQVVTALFVPCIPPRSGMA